MTEKHCTSCLSHIINLATQALLKARAEAKYRGFGVRDETGIVRNVSVKVRTFHIYFDFGILKHFQERSSGLRQTRFQKIQSDRGVKAPRNLLRDMPVRWSSSKIMLDRAMDHREV